MTTLRPTECRVLGVLVEKAQTTPGQYPLSLNAIQSGVSQKNNRAPLMTLDEDAVLAAVDGLRNKGLVREVMLSGSRVTKFRHIAREALEIGTSELVVLAELMLRGPQTVGELRGRASRMHPLESLEVASNILEHLATRDEPLVRRLSPLPGSRAERWMQLLCPDAHPLDVGSAEAATAPAGTAPAPGPPGPAVPPPADPGLAARVAALETALASLEAEVAGLRRSFMGAEDGSR